MAYDDQSFIQKLRQNQVLPPEGQGLPDPLIGMPEYKYGRNFARGINTGGGNNGGSGNFRIPPPQPITQPISLEQLHDIGTLTRTNKVEPPKNTAWIPGAADENAARIVLGETPNEKQGRALELQGTKNALGYGNLAIKSRAQDLREKVEAGKATDAEKQEYAKELIGMRGDITSGQIDQRGNIQRDLLDTRGEQATGLQNLRGKQGLNELNIKGGQRLNEIAQGALGKQSQADILSPSQERNQTNNNISRIMMESPELAKFLVKDPNTGQYAISDDANETTKNLIISRVNGSPSSNRDIKLPSGNNTTTPTSTTPKADMSLPSQSKYKVTVK